MEYEPANYAPTRVELAITVGAFALFAVVILLFVRFVPVVSMWEQAEQHEADERAAAARVGEGIPAGGVAAPAGLASGTEGGGS